MITGHEFILAFPCTMSLHGLQLNSENIGLQMERTKLLSEGEHQYPLAIAVNAKSV
jgi:hypothetical protein